MRTREGHIKDMYVPGSFRIEDEAQIEAFIRQYDFATIVSAPASGMIATHVPVVVRRTAAGITLIGHVARANSHWELMDGMLESLAMFLGPNAYVSPTWYASGPAVPTWNYAAVHAYGKARAIHDVDYSRDLLRDLVLRYEGPSGWSVESVPVEFAEKLMNAIVAFEMPVDRLEAKFKLGQNRSAEDRAGTIASLEREASPQAAALATFMRLHQDSG